MVESVALRRGHSQAWPRIQRLACEPRRTHARAVRSGYINDDGAQTTAKTRERFNLPPRQSYYSLPVEVISRWYTFARLPARALPPRETMEIRTSPVAQRNPYVIVLYEVIAYSPFESRMIVQLHKRYAFSTGSVLYNISNCFRVSISRSLG